MDNVIDCRLDSTYKEIYTGIWQHDYGQLLRITGVDLPKAVEVQFSLRDKGGDTLTRIGTTVDGVTEVKVPDSFLKNENCTQNYLIYAWIYVTDDASGNTEYQIILHVKSRPKPEEPSEEPLPEPNIFHETVEAVNASAERAENAASSATESAASAEETLIEIKRVTDAISENIENANTMKSELSDMINSAEEKKKELVASTEEAGETKMELDSSINSAGEKQLALDTTVEQANEVDASLKEQIGSAEQIQANVEQIGKNTQAISSLNEDLAEVQDKKITKFYASNQGETHLADSDSGKIVDMSIYGKSEQFTTTGKNLLPFPYTDKTKTENGVTFDVKDDGKIHIYGTATETTYFNLSNNIEWGNKSFSVKNERYILIGGLYYNAYNKILSCAVQKGETLDKILAPMVISINETNSTYEPYTGGIPSPNPDYPQEIKSVVNPVVKVCGKNLFKVIQGGYISNNDGSIYPTNEIEMGVTGFININNRDITVVGKKFNTSVQNAYAFRIGFYDAKKNWIKNIIIGDDEPYNINLFKVTNAEFIRVSAPSGIYDTIQVEKGSEATSYEPYTEQTVQLPYTLNAIPVDSGGNITIDGQQYIADRVVEKDGVFGIERNTATDVPVLTKKLRETTDMKGRFVQEYAFKKTFTPLYTSLVNIGYSKVWGVAGNVIDKWIFGVNKANLYISPPKDLNYTSEDAFNALKDLNIKVYGALSVSIFEPLPEDIQSKLRALSTNYPVTNIEVSSDQLDGYTVFNYPISMANGWNYVKQQLGDTRDYIYDMDTKTQDIDLQSAEAYVNSEYAVALTELEV